MNFLSDVVIIMTNFAKTVVASFFCFEKLCASAVPTFDMEIKYYFGFGFLEKKLNIDFMPLGGFADSFVFFAAGTPFAYNRVTQWAEQLDGAMLRSTAALLHHASLLCTKTRKSNHEPL